eukprot:8701923-Pyramimonas_sp.AAC.1
MPSLRGDDMAWEVWALAGAFASSTGPGNQINSCRRPLRCDAVLAPPVPQRGWQNPSVPLVRGERREARPIGRG